MPSKNSNPNIIPGVGTYSRSAVYKRSGRWALKNKATKATKTVAASEKKVKQFGKETRTIEAKHARSYEPTPSSNPLPGKSAPRPTHIRKSITPGTVLILLAGRFRGRRVVFLKSLPSGLLLVTGPYKFNGVPLRRVNAAYVVATSTKVDVTGVDVPAKFDDKYFARPKTRTAKSASDFFDGKAPAPLEAAKVADQKAFDAQIIQKAQATEHLADYLRARFSLKRGQYPHEMRF